MVLEKYILKEYIGIVILDYLYIAPNFFWNSKSIQFLI